ncbi:MAG: phosphate ABC transporter permease family protein, partial [Alphaproteobacteria bacterium]
MPITALLLALAILALLGYGLGRSRSLAVVKGSIRHLHSLPSYHGAYVALWCGVPALAVALAWLIAEPHIIERLVVGAMPAEFRDLSPDRLGTVVNEVKNLAAGYVAREPEPALRAAAEQYVSLRATGFAAMAVVSLAVAILGIVIGRRHVAPGLKARNRVERVMSLALMLGSTVAIFTTIGIVLS